MAVQISGNDITVPRDGSFTRNVTIGGTLTYEDVTNIDSVGLVTARTGIEIGARPGVAASISVDGNMIVSGITTLGNNLNVSGKATFTTPGGDDALLIKGDNYTSVRIQSARDSDSDHAMFQMLGSRGTNASPTIAQSGDTLGTLSARGYDGNSYASSSNINFEVDGTPGDGDMPGRITFSTASDGSESPSERLRITSAGKVGISTVSPDARLHILAGNEKGILIEDNSVSNNSPYLEIMAKRNDGNVHQSFSGQVFLSRNRTAQKVSAGLKLGTVLFGGNHTDGSKSNIAYPASIAGVSGGDFNSVSDMPTDLVFYTGSTGRTPSTPNVDSGSEAMRILSSGAVRKPLQPRFWAKSNSAQTLNTDGTNYIRDFNSEQFDTGGCYDGTNKFTAPITGYYHFGWHIMLNAANADSFTYFFGAPLVSGVDLQQEVMAQRSGGANYASVTASHLLYLTSGQYVQIRMRQSGGTGNLEVRSDQGYFWGYLAN